MSDLNGMSARIEKNLNATNQLCPQLKLYFVVDGACTVSIKDSTWQPGKDEFILVNPGLQHSVICSDQNTILCVVTLSGRSIADAAGVESTYFFCCSPGRKEPEYHEMRRILHELVYLLVQKAHRTACMEQSVLYKLLDCLMEHFRVDLKNQDILPADDVKMIRILQYINQNYSETISLTELADRMYLSKSALSRFFKKQTGVYFADYVSQIRLNYAMEDLIYTNKNMTKIAVDNGFSNPSAFNRIFRERYGESPSEYRKRNGQQAKDVEVRTPETTLQKELREKLSMEENASPDTVRILADTRNGSPFPKKWGRCINIGSAYNLTIANLQYHTLYLKEQLGFEYARIWNVFSRNLTISDGRTRGYYNYDKLDVVLDFLVSNHMKPFLDFGNRPDTAVYAPGDPIYCEVEYIPFESKEVWQDLLKDFILHISNRYGEAEVSGWIFEFSYDITYASDRTYYKADEFQYLDAFSFAWTVIHRALPGTKVGGPMGEILPDYAFLAEFLRGCRDRDCMPDFVSFMLFPYHTGKESGQVYTERDTTDQSEKEQIERMCRLLEENGGGDCALYITEWNNTLSNRNYLNDSCCRAAYIAKKLSQFPERVDLVSLWMASDWMSSYYDTVCITNGGSGLLTKDSIRKPAYFALDFLQKMGSTLIDRGANYLITRRTDGEYFILCFNYKWFAVNYFVQEEGIRDPDELRGIFEDSHPVELEFCLDHVPAAAEYIIKTRTINEEYGSVLTEWKNFQYDKKLRSSDIKYIRERCMPLLRMTRAAAEDGQLCFSITLQPHEVSLIHIYEEP